MANSLRVLVVEEEPGMRDGMAFSLKRAGFVTDLARNGAEALHLMRPGAYDAVVSGIRWNLPPRPGQESVLDGLQLTCRMRSVSPGLPVLHILTPPAAGRPVEYPHMAQVLPVLVKPFGPEALASALWKAIRSEEHLRAEAWGDGLVLLTQDKAYTESLFRAHKAAEMRANVLIESEGSGESERLARLIHSRGQRRGTPWVVLRCGSEGSDGPAAMEAQGGMEALLDRAEGGTLLIEDVGSLNLPRQDTLFRSLRNLPEWHPGRPGAPPLRVIATTSQSLEERVRAGTFKEELLYLLSVVPVRIPPLRERMGDLALLGAHVAEHFARANGQPSPQFAPSFLTALNQHGWPGNTQELESAIKRASALAAGPVLTAQDLAWMLKPGALDSIPPDPPERVSRTFLDSRQPVTRAGAQESRRDAIYADPKVPISNVPLGSLVALPLGLSLPDLERFWLLSTLAAVEGNRTRCAQQLGVALRTVRNKLNEYRTMGFQVPPSGRDRDED